jgi:hypothetical protein
MPVQADGQARTRAREQFEVLHRCYGPTSGCPTRQASARYQQNWARCIRHCRASDVARLCCRSRSCAGQSRHRAAPTGIRVRGPARRCWPWSSSAHVDHTASLGTARSRENFLYSVKAARSAFRKPGLRAALGRRPRPGSNRERRRSGLTGERTGSPSSSAPPVLRPARSASRSPSASLRDLRPLTWTAPTYEPAATRATAQTRPTL